MNPLNPNPSTGDALRAELVAVREAIVQKNEAIITANSEIRPLHEENARLRSALYAAKKAVEKAGSLRVEAERACASLSRLYDDSRQENVRQAIKIFDFVKLLATAHNRMQKLRQKNTTLCNENAVKEETYKQAEDEMRCLRIAYI